MVFMKSHRRKGVEVSNIEIQKGKNGDGTSYPVTQSSCSSDLPSSKHWEIPNIEM